MSRTTRRGSGSPQPPTWPPVPPLGGWTLMEAAEALCPREARLYKQDGAALDAVLAAHGPTGAKFGLASPDDWLSELLLTVLSELPYLELTGRDATKGFYNPRVRLEHDHLLAALRVFAAVRANEYGRSSHRFSVRLQFEVGEAHVESSFSDALAHPSDDRVLIAVRIEASRNAGATAAPHGPSAIAATKPTYSDDKCCVWLQSRIASWPEGEPPPSSAKCHAAAREHFAGDIPRDEFRNIRRGVAPPEWQKPGPRGPRN